MSSENEMDERLEAAYAVTGKYDVNQAERFILMYGHLVRYVAEDKGWYVWDGTRWEEDIVGSAPELGKAMAKTLMKLAIDRGDVVKTRDVEPLLNVTKMKSTLESAKTDARVAVSAEQLDSDIWALNCANGTVDLRTGELRPHNPDDLITKTTGIDYDPDAPCPQWFAFTAWAMQSRMELVTFLQRAIGMSLSGDTSERMILFCHGSGKNGKSVLLKTIREVLGSGYAQRMQSSTLEAVTFKKGGSSHSDDIAQLKGARFVYTSEMEEGSRFATAIVKDLTGDERLRARQIYKAGFEFMPEFTPWIAANHKPNVTAEDQAIWDRLRLIPFDARVPDDEVDRDLGRKLKDEAVGILAWAVKGCVDWHREGLNKPDEVIAATLGYREEMDVFADFLRYVVEIGPNMSRAPVMLRGTYHAWAKENVERDDPLYKLSQRGFKAHMEGHGWVQSKSGGREWNPPPRPTVDYARLALEAASRGPITPEEEAEWREEQRRIDAEEESRHSLVQGATS